VFWQLNRWFVDFPDQLFDTNAPSAAPIRPISISEANISASFFIYQIQSFFKSPVLRYLFAAFHPIRPGKKVRNASKSALRNVFFFFQSPESTQLSTKSHS
jgi:hypothetical protein